MNLIINDEMKANASKIKNHKIKDKSISSNKFPENFWDYLDRV